MPYIPQREEPPRQESPSPTPNPRIRWVLLIVSLTLIVYGSIRLIGYYSDLAAARQATDELRAAAPISSPAEKEAPADSGMPEPAATVSPALTVPPQAEKQPASDSLPAMDYPNGYELNARIQLLRKKNENIIGWITMDDLDEPVAFRDNTFFLNHDVTGKKNVNGALFLDEGTRLLTRPYTLLVYGHNMKTGAMFGNLKKYEEFTYAFRHRFLRFDTLYEEGHYVLFSVSQICVTPGKSRYLNLMDIRSANRKTRKNALDGLIRLGLHDMPTEVNEEDQVLLLITCVGDDDERLVVAARRLRDGESGQ